MLEVGLRHRILSCQIKMGKYIDYRIIQEKSDFIFLSQRIIQRDALKQACGFLSDTLSLPKRSSYS